VYDEIVVDPPHPVEGGSANDYDYVSGDPCNNLDLDGREMWRMIPGVRCGKALSRLAAYKQRQLRAFERINARREVPLTPQQQFEITIQSGYAQPSLTY
ncbi:MAG: hypothetical protein ACREEO_10495, partial [Phenylobacterium sp.]